jgi:hypothetical protein
MIYSIKFRLSQTRLLSIEALFKGYGAGLITSDELDNMLDILFGDIEV